MEDEEAEVVEEETTEETEIVAEAKAEAEVETQEEAVAMEEVAVAGEDVATRPKEPDVLEHSRGPSQTGITPRMNTLCSNLSICNNSLRYEMQETPLDA